MCGEEHQSLRQQAEGQGLAGSPCIMTNCGAQLRPLEDMAAVSLILEGFFMCWVTFGQGINSLATISFHGGRHGPCLWRSLLPLV